MTVILIAALAAALSAPAVSPGTYTNEEEVYFARDSARAPPPWIALRSDGAALVAVDAFGAPAAPLAGWTIVAEADGLRLTRADGTTTLLRRGRPVTCWSAVRKTAPRPDGKEDWWFRSGIHIHDQGGRAMVGGDAGTPAAVIRMRNVIWPVGSNRPSLVLYIHTPDAPDHAAAYSWADPKAARVGVNLRWIQASCTVDGLDVPAATERRTTP